jgi:GNAT superfamily N-acetyltransferase
MHERRNFWREPVLMARRRASHPLAVLRRRCTKRAARAVASPAVMIRPATDADLDAIHELILGLAEYERLPVTARKDDLRRHLSGPDRIVEVLLAEDDASREVVGFALFFPNFSTFRGSPGVYLEDLFVKPAHRGRGHGKALLAALARLAVERGWGRLVWSVLKWNEPSIRFYESLGATPMDEWTVYRLTGEPLHRLADEPRPDHDARPAGG